MRIPKGFQATVAALILTGTACLTPLFAADSKFAGYLVDRSCADNAKSQGYGNDYASTHKKECSLNASCSKDGYSIFTKGQWYQLDKKGMQLARKVLEESKSPEGHFVVVTGTLNKNEIAVSAIREVAQ